MAIEKALYKDAEEVTVIEEIDPFNLLVEYDGFRFRDEIIHFTKFWMEEDSNE